MQIFKKFVLNLIFSGQIYSGKYMISTFMKFLSEHFTLMNTSDFRKFVSQKKKKKKSNFMF